MPVLGHAFVGLATATCTRPPDRRSRGAALWTPILVTLAYLPDITTQGALLLGAGDWRSATHSLWFPVIAAGVLAFPLARLTRVSARRAGAVTFASALGHNLLDMLQATDALTWWSRSSRLAELSTPLIPAQPLHEVLFFGALFVVFQVCYRLIVWRRSRRQRRHPPPRRPLGAWSVVGVILTGAILLTAGFTHYLRDVRERHMRLALALLRQGDYVAALAAAERADRWPRGGAQRWIDYAKAEAYNGLGDRRLAEKHYLRACASEPSNYWALIRLALFYASSDEPLDERRRRTAPYVKRLKEQFADVKSLPRYLERIEGNLAGPPPGTAPAS